VARTPFRQSTSLTAMGSPSRGVERFAGDSWRRRSAASAARSARSGVNVMKACRRGSSRWMRSMNAWVSSRLEKSHAPGRPALARRQVWSARSWLGVKDRRDAELAVRGLRRAGQQVSRGRPGRAHRRAGGFAAAARPRWTESSPCPGSAGARHIPGWQKAAAVAFQLFGAQFQPRQLGNVLHFLQGKDHGWDYNI